MLKFFLVFALWLFLSLTACLPTPTATGQPPTATRDPFAAYRPTLQAAHQADFDQLKLNTLPHYQIRAQLSESQTHLSGTVTVTLARPVREPTFRLYPNVANYGGQMTIEQVLVDEQPASAELLIEQTVLRIPQQLTAAQRIQLDFQVALNSQPGHQAAFTLFGWNGTTLSLPGFFPMLAAQQAGAWVIDRPAAHGDVLFSEMAFYDLALTLPASLTVAASGQTRVTADHADGQRTWQISGGPLRDLTVIAGQFATVSETVEGTTVTVHYQPAQQAAALNVLQSSRDSLAYFNDQFGPYTYTELDVVQAPLNVRGMEYSGLILIGDQLWIDQTEFLTFLIAHEIAHQWWYGLVGNNPYREPWLDEGLTEFSAFRFYQHRFGQAKGERLLTARWLIPFEQAQAGQIEGVVDRPAHEFDATRYELLVYTKAALFFHRLAQHVGPARFTQILRTYYAEHRYEIVTPQHLIRTAERVTGEDLSPLAKQWLR